MSKSLAGGHRVVCFFLCGGPAHGSIVLGCSYLSINLPIIIFSLSNYILKSQPDWGSWSLKPLESIQTGEGWSYPLRFGFHLGSFVKRFLGHVGTCSFACLVFSQASLNFLPLPFLNACGAVEMAVLEEQPFCSSTWRPPEEAFLSKQWKQASFKAKQGSHSTFVNYILEKWV